MDRDRTESDGRVDLDGHSRRNTAAAISNLEISDFKGKRNGKNGKNEELQLQITNYKAALKRIVGLLLREALWDGKRL